MLWFGSSFFVLLGLTGWDYTHGLNHEYHRLFGRSRAVHNTFGHYETLSRSQINAPAFQIDNEMSVENEKEFIFFLMLMPMILTLHDAEPDH